MKKMLLLLVLTIPFTSC